MSFLHRVVRLSLRDREELCHPGEARSRAGAPEERSQLRWFKHVIRMPPGCLPGEMFRARPTGRRPPGRPRTRWRDYVFLLAWERLRIPLEELDEVTGKREVWVYLLRLLPARPDPG